MTKDEPERSSAPTPEQRDTARLLRDLFGHAFADRFLDFCRLSNDGAERDLHLRATLPLAAHAMREMESFLRQTLRGPFGIANEETPDAEENLKKASALLRDLGFEPNKANNAVQKLRKSTHAAEIRAICGRLGVAADGETAKIWLSLVDRQQKPTHRRSFHERAVADEEFRRESARPFQLLVRDVALALRRRYAVLIPAVDKLVAEPDQARAVKLFRDSIPGTLALQQRFFETIEGGEWLRPLIDKGVLRAPLTNLDDQEAGIVRWNEWAPAHYLKRIASSADAVARSLVAEALRGLKDSEDFGLRDKCFEVATALPSDEAAGLADVAVAWLKPRYYWTLKAPEQFLLHLMKGKQREATLTVARALFAVTRNEAGVLTRYDRFDYEHSLPPFIEPITQLCGLDALTLYCDLLEGAAIAKEFIKFDPPGDYTTATGALADESKSKHDIFAALAWAVKHCAAQLLREDKARTGAVVDLLMARNYRLFMQLALDAAALVPKELGVRAEELLKNRDLVGQSWCAREYGALARAAFPNLSPDDQNAILRDIDELPERVHEIWKHNFEQWQGRAPTEEEIAKFAVLSRRDALWHWREVLPAERRTELERIVEEDGPPWGEADTRFTWEGYRDVSPASAAEIVAKPAEDLITFLKTWTPAQDDERLTVSALGTELRTGVEQEPQKFAAVAESFADLGPHYILRIIEGLDNQARNHKPFDWPPVLALLAKVVVKAVAASPAPDATDRDDPSWSWVLLAAASLVRAGLYAGAAQFPKAELARVQSLIEALWSAPAIVPDDFVSRSEQDVYFAAQATLRGSVLEAAILYGGWCLPRDANGEPAAQRALPPLTLTILDAAIALDEADDPNLRAIIGHYFDTLLYLDQPWVDRRADALIGTSASASRRDVLWEGHLLRGHCTRDVWPYIQGCVSEEIERLGTDGYKNDRRGKPLVQILLTFYYWGFIGLEPGGVLSRFFGRANAELREHAAWFLHSDLNKAELAADKRERVHAFYEARIYAAEQSEQRHAHRRELGMLGLCFGKSPSENLWLLQQLRRLAALKLTPPHPVDLFGWLESMAAEQTGEVIACIDLMLQDDGFDQWMFMRHNAEVKRILKAGLGSPNSQTVARAKECANILVSRNQKDVLELAS